MDWGLKPLHAKMLQTLKDIHKFCEKYDIDYCLAYGSALGACRHNGFIPWDDDVDIYMTSDSYIKFKELFKLKGNKDLYYLQELGYCGDMVNFAKIRVNGTTFLESITKKFDMHHGLYVDIFILHNTDAKWFNLKKMVFAGKYLTIKRLSNLGYQRRSLYRPVLAFLRLFPYDFFRKWSLQQLYKFDKVQTDYFFEPEFESDVTYYKKDLIFPAVPHRFGDTFLKVPAKTSEYLSLYYGDYMKIPDVDSIKRSQHSAEWHINKDFKEILGREFSYKDEIIG